MYLIDIPTVAWVPIRTAIWNGRIEACAAAIAQFSEEVPALIETLGTGLSRVEVSITAPPKRVLKNLSARSMLVHARQAEFLRISATFILDRDKFKEENPDRDLDEEIAGAFAALYLAEAVEVLLVLSELAAPGRIDAAEGISVTESGGNARIRAKPSIFQLWFPEEGDPIWPPLATIPLSDVLEWSRSTSFLKRALATTRMERTLAAYTQMMQLGPLKEGETLFRAMQALEAFYCDGTGDLRKQLAEKSAMWLGQWSEKRNIVGLLYDMRSKFVHGSSKLQYWTDHADPWEEDEKHMRSFAHAVTLATRLVVATLQKCVVERAHSLEWSYSVRVSRDRRMG